LSNPNFLALNAELNLFGPDGEIQTDKDKEAARQYFLQHVNQNTVFFHSLEEKVEYMIDNGYWSEDLFESYGFDQVKELFKYTYAFKYRFESFVGAHKFYTSYALKTYDGERYLERFEDRVAITALSLAEGDILLAKDLVAIIAGGMFQPATPTFLNAGREDAGEQVSCFLLRLEDNMESIGRGINSSLQLSKRGGGVALLLSNIREANAPIKNVEGASSGIIPIMKLLEDSFSYANQLGARQGAGAVYLNVHHPDIMTFLDTKRENADEKIRIKTLSLGVVIPDITFELAKQGKDMALFSPYDVERVTGKAFADQSVTQNYEAWEADDRIRKEYISARKLFTTLAEIQFESGYPYMMFEDTVNAANPIDGWINMSNLCSEILQVNTPSEFNEDLSYKKVGQDISCNLGSLNISNVMEDPVSLGFTVRTAVKALTAVSRQTSIESVPSIREGNKAMRSIGLGQMNLHGFLAQNHIHYGSEEALDFTNVYFAAVRYHALVQSMGLARQYGPFEGFEKSDYATGKALEKYLENSYLPTTEKVEDLFFGAYLPTITEWAALNEQIQKYGLYHSYLLAVPPTGNISYVNGATASIHPVTSPVEIRKEAKMGRVYYPAPGLSKETLPYYQDAYEIGWKKIIDTYAVATEHTDQGLSLTLFFKDTDTTRDVNKAQIYAWRKGIKTIYYARVRQDALEGTEVENCVSCTL
jgi:ribonucleoside-diphosphate reductase alpha chain